MRNRTRVVTAAVAVTVVVTAGSTAAAMASTPGAGPAAVHQVKTVSPSEKGATDNNRLAVLLGVSPARLDQALREVKTSLIKSSAKPTPDQFDAMLARLLGIPLTRVRQAFPPGTPGDAKIDRSKAVGSKANPQPSEDAFTAAVASELHVSTAQVGEALQPMYAVGYIDPSSSAFAAAARSLGVSTQQLLTALKQAKQSLADATGGK